MWARNRNREQGGSKINTILTLLIVGFLVFTAFKIVPAYIANFQLQDALQTEARFAITSKKDTEQIREDVWKKVQELGIDTKRESIKVSYGDRSVDITVDYTVPVDLKVYQFSLDFHPHADNHTI
jgi:hypothetical protein